MPIKSVKMKTVISSSCTEKHTDRLTDTKVTTVGTLSGFQEFFLPPIIKDRPKKILPLDYAGPEMIFSYFYYFIQGKHKHT